MRQRGPRSTNRGGGHAAIVCGCVPQQERTGPHRFGDHFRPAEAHLGRFSECVFRWGWNRRQPVPEGSAPVCQGTVPSSSSWLWSEGDTESPHGPVVRTAASGQSPRPLWGTTHRLSLVANSKPNPEQPGDSTATPTLHPQRHSVDSTASMPETPGPWGRQEPSSNLQVGDDRSSLHPSSFLRFGRSEPPIAMQNRKAGCVVHFHGIGFFR